MSFKSEKTESKLADIACHVLNDKSLRLQCSGSQGQFLKELFYFQRNPLMVQVVPGRVGPKVVICDKLGENGYCTFARKQCYLLDKTKKAYQPSTNSQKGILERLESRTVSNDLEIQNEQTIQLPLTADHYEI